MALVLPNGITELRLASIDVLRPHLAVSPSIDVPCVVLGLNDKDAIGGNHHVVYLRAVSVVLQQEVIDNLVLLLRQFLQSFGYGQFPNLTTRFPMPVSP